MKKSIKLLIASTIKFCTITFITICYANCQSIAQNLVASSVAENLIFPIGQAFLSTAVIDYTPNCPTCSPGQLKVVAGSPGGGAYVTVDDGISVPINITLPSYAVTASVAVGNNFSPTTDYLVAVVYRDISTNVYLDIYDIQNVGTSTPLIALSTYSRTLSTTASMYQIPHIDIMAEYGNLFLGLPRCDKFVATWSEDLGSSTIDVIGYYSSLNAPSTYAQTTIAHLSGTEYVFPDVAAIQREVGGHISDMALFTYTDHPMGSGSNNNLFYTEWDISTATLSSTTTLETLGLSLSPRIAAIDDYNINDPLGLKAYYMVVAEHGYYTYGVTGHFGVKEYNKYEPTGLEIAIPEIGTYTYQIPQPTISCGPCTNYTVTYGYTPLYYFGVLANVIEWATGDPMYYCGGCTPNQFASVNYYQLSYLYPGNGASGGDYGPGNSSTCNGAGPNYAPYVFTAWNDSDNSTNVTETYDKLTDCHLVFKTSKVSEVNSTEWKVYPSPAIDYITLTSNGSTAGYTYAIVDITGRTILHAGVTSAKQQLDISTLEPGMYIVSIYNDNKVVKTMKFVKE